MSKKAQVKTQAGPTPKAAAPKPAAAPQPAPAPPAQPGQTAPPAQTGQPGELPQPGIQPGQPRKLTEEEKAARRAKRAAQKSFATLAEEVAIATGQSAGVVTSILQELKAVIVRAVRKGEVVLMGPDFGAFKAHTTQERKARNPRTGEEISVPPRTLVKFQMGAGLKALMFGEGTPATKAPGTAAAATPGTTAGATAGTRGGPLTEDQKKMRAEKIARKKALKAAEGQVDVGAPNAAGAVPGEETGSFPEGKLMESDEGDGVSDAEIEAILSEEGIEESF